jgi:hypothetical protein
MGGSLNTKVCMSVKPASKNTHNAKIAWFKAGEKKISNIMGLTQF